MEKYNIELFSSSNYDSFEFDSRNREVKMSKVSNLVRELGRKNFLHHFPIIVRKNGRMLNPKYTILDGQHRFMACKKLDIPVVYKLANDIEINDVSYINSVSHNWASIDYVRYHAQQGNINYKNLLNLVKLGFDVRGAQILFGSDIDSNKIDEFRTGLWIPKRSMHKAMSYANIFLDLRDNLDIKYATSQRFVRAFMWLILTKKANIDILISRINTYRQKMYKCTTREEYKVMLIKLYNYNTTVKNRLTFDFVGKANNWI